MTPVTSSSLLPTSTSNESHTRSDELRARSRFATHGRNQQRTSNHRAQRAPQQGAEERTQRRSATMFAVFLLCVLRARYDLLLDTKGLCNTSHDSVRQPQTSVVQVWHVDGVWLKHKRKKERQHRGKSRKKGEQKGTKGGKKKKNAVTRVNKRWERNSSLGGLPTRSSDCSRFCTRLKFCFVIFKTGVPHRFVGSCGRQVHCETFTESQPCRTR